MSPQSGPPTYLGKIFAPTDVLAIRGAALFIAVTAASERETKRSVITGLNGSCSR